MFEPASLPEEYCEAGASGIILTVDIAMEKAIAAARRVPEIERLALLDAAGRILANPIHSPMFLPPFDSSAMDGYAFSFADLSGSGPWMLKVSGRLAAGGVPPRGAGRGTAIRIFTGAIIPPGYDTVVMQEHCELRGETIVISNRPAKGTNVRRTGEDAAAGSRLTEAGDLLSPAKLVLLAGAGIAEVDVFRRVRIGLISTGSELREPGDALQPGQIYNSNRVLLRASLTAHSWTDVIDFGIVPDDRARLAEVIALAAAQCDVVVTTGGVSAGEEDHVASVLGAAGASLEVLKVAMRPGKPLKIGLIGNVLFAGLPGNPNASLVTFRQIALPAIRHIAGLRQILPEWQAAISGFSYEKRLGRTEFVPVRVAETSEAFAPVIDILGRASSASLSALSRSDGIALLSPEATSITPGAKLRFERLWPV
ncbi:molybdopterin molybdotransferase MoeA [Chelativorans sp. YIM 93263]|uniref:molybdopterin molybdotransferase MoeA n=1 Tax=Chelativorans sp. YIM 93263 TaxID=2906648 RepID=UPI002379F38A|nr:gephyrin-like molybdotransferase Glp [Chelativorans sp. YIM 93263]